MKIVLNKFFIHSLHFTQLLALFSCDIFSRSARRTSLRFSDCAAKTVPLDFRSSITKNRSDYEHTKNRGRQIQRPISGQTSNGWNGFRAMRKKAQHFYKSRLGRFLGFRVCGVCLGHTFFVRNLSTRQTSKRFWIFKTAMFKWRRISLARQVVLFPGDGQKDNARNNCSKQNVNNSIIPPSSR